MKSLYDINLRFSYTGGKYLIIKNSLKGGCPPSGKCPVVKNCTGENVCLPLGVVLEITKIGKQSKA